MKSVRSTLIISLAIFIGCGFATCRRVAVDPAPTAPIGKEADKKRAEEREAITSRDSQQLASLDALLGRVPDLREEAWRAELGIMRARYGKEAKPRANDLVEAVARVAAWAEGRVEEARASTAVALANANDLAARLALAEAARKNAEASEVASRLASERRIGELEQQVKDNDNKVLKNTAYGIVGFSLLVLLLSGVAIYLSPNKFGKLMDVWPFIVGGILGLGLAQLIMRPWFMTACIVTGVIILAGCAWWGYRKHEKGKLADALAEKAAQTQAIASKVIPAIDDTYDALQKGAVTSGEEVFKALYARLSQVMDKKEKAAVHTVRAETKAV